MTVLLEYWDLPFSIITERAREERVHSVVLGSVAVQGAVDAVLRAQPNGSIPKLPGPAATSFANR